MKVHPLPSLEYLNECFELDKTAKSWLKWKVRPKHHFKNENSNYFNSRCPGKDAGILDKQGYYFVYINSIMFRAHRIVWALFNKSTDIASSFIDHIYNNPSNNNPENLRLVSHLENMMNRKVNKNSKSGVRGVYQSNNKWVSHIYINNTRYSLGAYDNINDAILARKQAEEKSLLYYYKGLSDEEIFEKTNLPNYYSVNKDGSPNKAWLKKQKKC